MARMTPATRTLDAAGVPYTLHEYVYAPGDGAVGLQAADALGESPACVFKTLMALADDKPVCAIVPSDATVAMKRLATALGARAARMMPPADAERLTGYHIGGISPFGQKRRVPIAIDASAMAQSHIYLNGGRRGLQLRLVPADAVRALAAIVAPLV